MSIDSAKKRKSIAAISLLAVGPVVVPDSTIDQADRQVVGYSYSGIAAGEPSDTSAEYICQRNEAINIGSATASINIASATASIVC